MALSSHCDVFETIHEVGSAGSPVPPGGQSPRCPVRSPWSSGSQPRLRGAPHEIQPSAAGPGRAALNAYANGTYVYRNGNGLSRPSLDSEKSSIGNDTITAFVSVYRATIPKDLDWILQAVGTVEKGS